MASPNLLYERLVRASFEGRESLLSLPDVLAALAADRVDGYTALRAHQDPAWHMFLCQLAAVACHRGGLTSPPVDAEVWADLLRALTPAYPDDAPWRLVVEDPSQPAFLQPPIPDGVALKTEVATPDALDLLILSKNHDLKAQVAREAALDDWLFALVSLQTCEGYGGAGNHGVARMNGGSSSRSLLSLAPMPAARATALRPRPGARFGRDVTRMLAERDRSIEASGLGYPAAGGLALTWIAPWPEKAQLALHDLDIWFIEVCRRVRLRSARGRISARAGTSAAARIDAKAFNGALGDPWAPVHRTEGKALTLGEDGEFDYRRIVDLMIGEPGSGARNWEAPLLAGLGPTDTALGSSWLLVAQALARGNSKTGGYRERVIPIDWRSAARLGGDAPTLHAAARAQIDEASKVSSALRNALALLVANGDRDRRNRKSYEQTAPFRRRLDREIDALFFPALWRRFDADSAGDAAAADEARMSYLRRLADAAETLLEAGLRVLPCAANWRLRAEVRARSAFYAELRKELPQLFASPPNGASEPAHVE